MPTKPIATSVALPPVDTPQLGAKDVWGPSVIIALAVAAAGLMGWLGKLQWGIANAVRDLKETKEETTELAARVKLLEDRTHQNEVAAAKISEKLTNLEKGVDEVKDMIRRLADQFSPKR